MSSYFNDVGEFHNKFELPVAGVDQEPTFLSRRDELYRVNFMREEVEEFQTACMKGDIAEAADALADLVYVALGTAHLMGLPFEEIWTEVQRANLTKERATGADDPRSKRANSLDVVKPEGWKAPDHGPALKAAGWVMEE